MTTRDSEPFASSAARTSGPPYSAPDFDPADSGVFSGPNMPFPLLRTRAVRRDSAPMSSARACVVHVLPDLVPLHGLSEHNFYCGLSVVPRAEGLFVATYSPRALGEHVEVRFTVPHLDQELSARCVVAWLREYDETIEAPGMGLRFLSLEPSAEQAVKLFVRWREPIFFAH